MNIRMNFKLYDSYPNFRKSRTTLSHALILKIMMMCTDGFVKS